MHELAAIQNAVRTALEYMRQAEAARVTNVQLSVGTSGHLSEEVIRQYFALFTADTPAHDATLTIIWLPATYQCLSCLHIFESLQSALEVLCPTCGDAALEINHQDTCAVSAIDVAFDERSQAPAAAHPTTTIFLGDEAPQWQA